MYHVSQLQLTKYWSEHRVMAGSQYEAGSARVVNVAGEIIFC